MPYKDPIKRKLHNEQYRKTHREQLRMTNKRWRERNQEYLKEYYLKNRERNIKRSINYREEKKKLCLIHYSGNPPKCACCGEKIYEFLTIDHINGDGAQHRKKIKGSGSKIYYWLVQNNYPKGFQVLCMNCNWASRISGICPHKKYV